jgi:hypothetical protein
MPEEPGPRPRAPNKTANDATLEAYQRELTLHEAATKAFKQADRIYGLTVAGIIKNNQAQEAAFEKGKKDFYGLIYGQLSDGARAVLRSTELGKRAMEPTTIDAIDLVNAIRFFITGRVSGDVETLFTTAQHAYRNCRQKPNQSPQSYYEEFSIKYATLLSAAQELHALLQDDSGDDLSSTRSEVRVDDTEESLMAFVLGLYEEYPTKPSKEAIASYSAVNNFKSKFLGRLDNGNIEPRKIFRSTVVQGSLLKIVELITQDTFDRLQRPDTLATLMWQQGNSIKGAGTYVTKFTDASGGTQASDDDRSFTRVRNKGNKGKGDEARSKSPDKDKSDEAPSKLGGTGKGDDPHPQKFKTCDSCGAHGHNWYHSLCDQGKARLLRETQRIETAKQTAAAGGGASGGSKPN